MLTIGFHDEGGEGDCWKDGFVLFRRPPYPKSLSGVDAYIMNMFTVPEWRGKGIGGDLLDIVFNIAKTMASEEYGCMHLKLEDRCI